MKGHEIVIQERLGPEQTEDYYLFPEGTVVYPQSSGRGVLTDPLQAEKLKGRVKGLQAWMAEANMHLFLNGEYWQLSRGTSFGAPVRSAKRVKVKLK